MNRKTESLLSVEAALSRVLDGVSTLPAEEVPVGEAHGRVLTGPLAALRTQPPADVSSMDGYAARAADLTAPATLKLIGESAAGHEFAGQVKAREAARIFTGAILPPGADTVIAQEDAEAEGDTVSLPAAKLGQFVRRRGLDFVEGKTMLEAGRRLTARDVGLAAAMDHARVRVARRPRVAIIATGDELALPGTGGDPNRIVASNPISLAALLRNENAHVSDLGIVPDKIEAIVAAMRLARDNTDILITLGGASVGDHDLIAPALKAEGIALAFHRVALRPGRPLLLGLAGPLRVLGLPGNPVSSYVCACLFLVPLLRKLQGRTDFAPAPVPAVLGQDMKPNDHRQDYLRAKITRGGDGRLVASPHERQDSSMQALMVESDGLLIRKPNAPAAKAGEPCEVILFAD
ncbi:MAG TPA: gephyrin-like molybdotransferase Glp [Xanthobacteraceae bacterium]|nr:gephyrin-like molybdotransferase Glp [Xanthobacteraceae bacterium]